MSNKANLEKIYDLIEKYSFDELNEQQKELVINNITKKEYQDMRSTIDDTQKFFAKYPENVIKEKKKTLKQILAFPIEFYKVAASLLILLAIGFLYTHSLSKGNLENKKQIDTVFVSIIDTLMIKTTDTVEIIKEKTVYKNQEIVQNTTNTKNETRYVSNNYSSISKNAISVDDLKDFDKIKTKGDISQDSALSEFVVAMN